MTWERGQGICQYTFEVPDYEFDEDEVSGEKRYLLSDDVPGVSDGTWTCAHPKLSGKDTCPFHTDIEERPDNFDETRAFLGVIDQVSNIRDRQTRRRRLQFIDAEFVELDLRGEVVGGADNQYINLTESTVGTIDCVDTRIKQPIRFANVTVEGDATFRDTVFESNAGFQLTRFEGEVNFRGAEFTEPASFKIATFENKVSFWYATFHHHGLFKLAKFHDSVRFEAVDFNDYARFIRAKFYDDVDFKLAEFRDDADFVGAKFNGDHTFSKAIVDRKFDISDAVVNSPMHLDNMTIKKIELTPRQGLPASQLVDFSGSTIHNGELGQPPGGNVLYDLTDATLGNVEFSQPEGDIDTNSIRFLRTKYDGFDFEGGDLNPQSDNWRLHNVFDPTLLPEDSEINPQTADLRKTYLNAKNGADQTGNNTAVGAFYYREMSYRRKRHRELVEDGSRQLSERIHDTNRFIRNATLWITTGYGEKPGRVIATSVGVVGVFTLIYTGLFTGQSDGLTEALLLSIQSYITFVLGPAPVNSSMLVEVVSAIQGFLGAFLVALFVFTFTRRLNR